MDFIKKTVSTLWHRVKILKTKSKKLFLISVKGKEKRILIAIYKMQFISLIIISLQKSYTENSPSSILFQKAVIKWLITHYHILPLQTLLQE